MEIEIFFGNLSFKEYLIKEFKNLVKEIKRILKYLKKYPHLQLGLITTFFILIYTGSPFNVFGFLVGVLIWHGFFIKHQARKKSRKC